MMFQDEDGEVMRRARLLEKLKDDADTRDYAAERDAQRRAAWEQACDDAAKKSDESGCMVWLVTLAGVGTLVGGFLLARSI